MADPTLYHQQLHRQLDLQRGNIDMSGMSMGQRRSTIAQINSQGNAAAAWLKRHSPGSLPQDNEFTVNENNTVSISDDYFNRLAGYANQPRNRTAVSSRLARTNTTPANATPANRTIQSIQSQAPTNNPSNKKYWMANYQSTQPTVQTAQQINQNQASRMQVENPYSASYFNRREFNYPTPYQGTQLQIGNQTFRLINYADGGHELFSPHNTIQSSGSGFNERSVQNEMKALGVDLNSTQGQQQYQTYLNALKSGPTRRSVQNQNPAPTAGTFLISTGSQSAPIQSTNLGSRNVGNVTPSSPLSTTNTAQQLRNNQNVSVNNTRSYQVTGGPLNMPTPNQYPTTPVGVVSSAWKRMFNL